MPSLHLTFCALPALEGFEKVLQDRITSPLSIQSTTLGILYGSQGKLADQWQRAKEPLAGHENAQGPEHLFTLEAANHEQLGSSLWQPSY